ncbi:hypothetical protein PFWH6_2271 [Pseudomonas fluorescens WH6]|nr:hypothetical protein PFWH6_2271 [Pseudomonas fluorescens WH6]
MVTPSYCWPQDSPGGKGVRARAVPIYKLLIINGLYKIYKQ